MVVTVESKAASTFLSDEKIAALLSFHHGNKWLAAVG
jgi:hypothetical protein